MTAPYDVIVAGSGPAAASAAIRLASRGVNAVVMEGRPAPAPEGETLPPHTRAELIKTGFRIEPLSADWIESYGIEAMWGGQKTFHSHVFDADGSAMQIVRPRFLSTLLDQARSRGAKVWPGHSLVHATRKSDRWHVIVKSGASILEVGAAWLVDATGRGARVVASQGIGRRKYDRLCGVAAVLPRPTMPQALAVESAPYGWWYVAPFSASHAIACLVSDVDIVISMGALRSHVWLSLFNSTRLLGNPIRDFETLRPRLFPCETSIANEVAGEGWVAIGDAACSLDPLASAGIMKAVYSGRLAADAVADALGGGNTAGLDRYRTALRSDFETYLSIRSAQYSLETRWPEQPFWQRRIRLRTQAA